MSEDGKPDLFGASFSRRTFCASVLGAGISLVTACSSNRAQSADPLFQGSSWGAFLPTVAGNHRSTTALIDRLVTLAGARPEVVHLFSAINDSLPTEALDAVYNAGATPMLSLEPWRPDDGQTQTAYSLASIVSGQHDSDLSRWAAQLAAWSRPILLRFAQEMNGTWYPWSIGANSNTAADYRAAWSRMHSIVSERAPHVRFVWAPNAITEGTRDFTDCYPGGDVVDYLGLDGYNWGQTPGHQWQSPEKLFSNSLEVLGRLAPDRPILITEVGCADNADRNLKAQWISDFFSTIESHPAVAGFVWFQMDKERDWRFNSTPASTKSFRDGLARWMSSGRPR